MLLLKAKALVQQQREITLTRLAQNFDVPETVMADMMQKWVDKGIIGKAEITTECAPQSCTNSGCGGCSSAATVTPAKIIRYFWKGSV